MTAKKLSSIVLDKLLHPTGSIREAEWLQSEVAALEAEAARLREELAEAKRQAEVQEALARMWREGMESLLGRMTAWAKSLPEYARAAAHAEHDAARAAGRGTEET